MGTVAADDGGKKARAIRDGVGVFRTCGRPAQKFLLENGYWTSLNDWTKFAITLKDVPLITDLLQLLLTIPTTFPQLTGDGGQLTLTVEGLLKQLAFKKSDFNEEDTEQVKRLCAEVFARWLLIKKNNCDDKKTDDVDDNGRMDVTEEETGQSVVIVQVENKPGFGFMKKNGKISVVEIKAYQEPEEFQLPPVPLPPAPPSPCPSFLNDSCETVIIPRSDKNESAGVPLSDISTSCDEEEEYVDIETVDSPEAKSPLPPPPPPPVEQADEVEDAGKEGGVNNSSNEKRKKQMHDDRISKKLRPNNLPKVFVTSKSRSDNLLEEMLTVSAPAPLPEDTSSNSPPGGKKPTEEVGTTVTKQLELEESTNNNVKICDPRVQRTPKKVPPPPPQLSSILTPVKEDFNLNTILLEEMHNSTDLNDIGKDLGKPKKMVTWFGQDGIREICPYPRDEFHVRRGSVKEKWNSIAVIFSEDEYDDDIDADGLVVEEQKTAIPVFPIVSDPRRNRGSPPGIQWNRRTSVQYKEDDRNKVPWKLHRIPSTMRRPIQVQVNSQEKEKFEKKRREGRIGPAAPTIYSYSPAEPDLENDTEIFNCIIIPVEDIKGHILEEKDTQVYDYTQMTWPEPKKEPVKKSVEGWSPFKLGFSLSY